MKGAFSAFYQISVENLSFSRILAKNPWFAVLPKKYKGFKEFSIVDFTLWQTLWPVHKRRLFRNGHFELWHFVGNFFPFFY